MKELPLQFQELSEALDMAVILAKGILKPVLMPEDVLTPGAVLLVAKNPAPEVLSLNRDTCPLSSESATHRSR